MTKKQRKQIRKNLLAEKVKTSRLTRSKFERRKNGFKELILREKVIINGEEEQPKRIKFELSASDHRFLEEIRMRIRGW